MTKPGYSIKQSEAIHNKIVDIIQLLHIINSTTDYGCFYSFSGHVSYFNVYLTRDKHFNWDEKVYASCIINTAPSPFACSVTVEHVYKKTIKDLDEVYTDLMTQFVNQ